MTPGNEGHGGSRLPMFTLTPLSGKNVGRERKIHVNIIGDTSIINIILSSVGIFVGLVVGIIFSSLFGPWGWLSAPVVIAISIFLLIGRRRDGVRIRRAQHLARSIATKQERGKIFYAGELHDPGDSPMISLLPGSMPYEDLPESQKHHLDDLGDMGLIVPPAAPRSRVRPVAQWGSHELRCNAWAKNRNRELIAAAYKANPLAFRGKDLPSQNL